MLTSVRPNDPNLSLPLFEEDADGSIWRILPHDTIDGRIDLLADSVGQPHPSGKQPLGVRLRVPPDEGCGTLEILQLSPALYVMHLNVEYHDDRRIEIPGERFVKIRILLAGGLTASQDNISLEGTGAYLEAFPGDVANHYVVKGGVPTRLVVLNCRPTFFTDELHLDPAMLPDPVAYLFQCASGAPRSGTAPLSPDVLRAANDMLRASSHFPAHLLSAYLGARARETVCSVLRELATAGAQAREKLRLSVRDVNRLYEARDTLLDQFQRPPSIPKLARQVGLNQTKLKAGFKAVFGMTMHEFTQKCRMERASELLTTSGLSIAEVAFAVGYDYPANFTFAFKRFFGHVPRQFKRAGELHRP